MLKTDGLPQETIKRIIRYQVCAECGAFLKLSSEGNQTVIVCERFREHNGTAKPYEERDYNIATRREFMEAEIGEQKTQALAKYSGVTSLTRVQTDEIIDTIWPEARAVSPAEVFKAVTIATQYGLNPLMRHLYLIPFKTKVGDNRWETRYATVLGIGATRLIAARKHTYSYIEDSPRLMTEDEQKKVFGEVSANKLQAVTILKDMKTGATARGYGSWPKDTEPKGVDKGNSKANMAFIRSERQALDRLYPADLPRNIEVVDERFEVTATVEPPTIPPAGDVTVAQTTPADEDFGKLGHDQPAETKDTAADVAPATVATVTKEEPQPGPGQGKCKHGIFDLEKGCPQCIEEKKPTQVEGVDLDWLKESLNKLSWTTVGKWLREKYPYVTGTKISDIVKSLKVEDRKAFAKEVQSRLEMT